MTLVPPAPAGLYVHVPFCASKCAYCAFHSEVAPHRITAWLDAVERELARHAVAFGTFDTLYLGGGTPSVLPMPVLSRLISVINEVSTFAIDAERTIEVNPGDVDPMRAEQLLALGFHRASVGVQSLCDEDLAFLGRRHDAATARAALRVLRDAGFASLGVDVIYALPGRSSEGVTQTLEEILSHEPEHVSCYELTLESRTPLGLAVDRGDLEPIGEEQAVAASLDVWRTLDRAGYEHYEVSNFAKGAGHRSRHNQKYWSHVPYLGVGPAAHSFDGRRRWSNVSSIQAYVDALGRGEAPVQHAETLSAVQLRVERIALGLRTSHGVALDDLHDPASQALLENLVREGLVTVGERVCVTESGLLVADGLARAFVSASDE